MTTKEKYELIDKTKINEKVLAILQNMEKSSSNFTDEAVNSKIDGALDKLIEGFRANKPEALRTLPEAKKEVKKEKEKATKENEGKDLSDKKDTDDKTGLPKKDTLEERKDIIKKQSESDKEARDRARKELEKEKEKAKDEVESQIEKLNRIILEDPSLRGFNTGTAATGGGRSTPIIDAERKALPRGSRVSQKGWKNQYGASDGGRKYWENRENRSDRKSPEYETGKPYLAKGGKIKSNPIINQYEGRLYDDIWNNWTETQRYNFIKAYKLQIEKRIDYTRDIYSNEFPKRLKDSFIRTAYGSTWKNLDDNVKNIFMSHVTKGQFAKGGEMADGGGVPYKPYGKTKGRFTLKYEDDGEQQIEIWSSLEEATNSARRYVNPKLGYTNVHIYDESGKEYFFADGGDLNDILSKMRSSYENLEMRVKGKIASAVGIDEAIRIMENDYEIHPFDFITRAVRSGLLGLDEINRDLVFSALIEAENITEEYRDSGQGIGSSDMTYFTKHVLDYAGFKTGFVNNRLTRVDADGNELVIDKYEMNY
jgi:hypothetical protein